MRYFDKKAIGSVPGGAAAGKPSAISKSLLELLKDVSEPQQKPKPSPIKMRMKKGHLNSLKAKLSPNQEHVMGVSLSFVRVNTPTLHPEDLSELVKTTIKNGSVLYDPVLVFNLIKGLPGSHKATCIKSALNSRFGMYIQSRAIPLIAALPEEYHSELYNLASKAIKAAINSMWRHEQFDGVDGIRFLPLQLQGECIELALNSEYEKVRQKAKRIKN